MGSVIPSAQGAVQRISFGPQGGNGAAGVNFERATPDLSNVACTSTEQLTADDTDDTFDLYFCAGDATTRLSTGATGGNETGNQTIQYHAVDLSNDGSHVFFETTESLVPADTDGGAFFPYGAVDVYERTGSTTNLVSTGPTDGNSSGAMSDTTASADGSSVIFYADGEKLTADSTAFTSFYRRTGSTLELIGSSPSLAPEDYRGGSADLSKLVFASAGQFAGDPDGAFDLFGWSGGTTALLSPGGGPLTEPGSLVPAYISPDGNRVLFVTDSQLVPQDTDGSRDLYLASGGVVSLLSTGPSGGNGGNTVVYAGASADATHAFFCTDEPLLPADGDADVDLYEAFNGTTTLVSQGAGGSGPSADACIDDGIDAGNDRNSVSVAGDRIVFTTTERLVPQDTDTSADLYERAGGVTTLVSTGPGSGNGAADATWLGSSDDGRVVYFRTVEKLVAADTDAAADVYARVNGSETILVTPPPVAGSAGGTDIARSGWTNTPKRRPVSSDGSSIIIATGERLSADDTDSSTDLYRGTITVPHTDATPPTGTTPPPTAPATTVVSAARKPALGVLPAFAQIVTLPSTKGCVSNRKFRIRVRTPKNVKIASVTVLLNAKKIAVHSGKRITTPIDLRKLPTGRFTVKVQIKLADGRRVSGSRRYRTCAPKHHH